MIHPTTYEIKRGCPVPGVVAYRYEAMYTRAPYVYEVEGWAASSRKAKRSIRKWMRAIERGRL